MGREGEGVGEMGRLDEETDRRAVGAGRMRDACRRGFWGAETVDVYQKPIRHYSTTTAAATTTITTTEKASSSACGIFNWACDRRPHGTAQHNTDGRGWPGLCELWAAVWIFRAALTHCIARGGWVVCLSVCLLCGIFFACSSFLLSYIGGRVGNGWKGREGGRETGEGRCVS